MKTKKLTLDKGQVLDLLDCVNAWVIQYGYENMRTEMKELASNLLNINSELEDEEEQLYTVTINLDRKYHLVVDEGDGDGDEEIITTLTTTPDVFGYRYELTEQEIKSADTNLWQIAVPVEEEED